MPPAIPKPKCPECDTELVLVEGKPPDECGKCGFLLSGYPEFQRWISAALKAITPTAPATRPSPLAGLLGRKK